MKSALLLSLLLALVPAAVRAEVETFLPVKPGQMMAQFSPEQRRALRERWEQASPEERARIREEFHQRRLMSPDLMERPREIAERLRNMSSEEREALRRQRAERPAAPDNNSFQGGFEGGFGAGFERRRVEDAPASGERTDVLPRPGMRPGGGSGFMPRPRQP